MLPELPSAVQPKEGINKPKRSRVRLPKRNKSGMGLPKPLLQILKSRDALSTILNQASAELFTSSATSSTGMAKFSWLRLCSMTNLYSS